MGKNVVVFLFLLTCALAVYVLATRKIVAPIDSDPDAAKEPRVSLEEFTVYKYEGHKVTSTFSGKLAHFVDPNILEIYGSLRGLRHNSEKREYVSSESATVYFSASGISQLMDNAKIVEVELEDNVNVGVKFHRLLTEFAEYLPNQNLLQSELPVTLKGPNGDFEGKNGFLFHLQKEKVRIFGPIEGVLQGASIPN